MIAVITLTTITTTTTTTIITRTTLRLRRRHDVVSHPRTLSGTNFMMEWGNDSVTHFMPYHLLPRACSAGMNSYRPYQWLVSYYRSPRRVQCCVQSLISCHSRAVCRSRNRFLVFRRRVVSDYNIKFVLMTTIIAHVK